MRQGLRRVIHQFFVFDYMHLGNPICRKVARRRSPILTDQHSLYSGVHLGGDIGRKVEHLQRELADFTLLQLEKRQYHHSTPISCSSAATLGAAPGPSPSTST